MSVSLMLHWKVFHEFQPMGGVAAITVEAEPSEPTALSVPESLAASGPESEPESTLESIPESRPELPPELELELELVLVPDPELDPLEELSPELELDVDSPVAPLDETPVPDEELVRPFTAELLEA
jgi:hypothetical protein